jgi:uncharacterized membrane protein
LSKSRLEAFSDGVIAILITIMVLELKVPAGAEWRSLVDHDSHLTGVFLAYVLSFIYIGIYWNNHHHMMHTVDHVNGRILWANLHLLFWLSLVPFTAAWVGEHGHVAPAPTALYGIDLFCAGVAYVILQSEIIRSQGAYSKLAKLIGRDLKGKSSAILYAAAIPLAYVNEWISFGIYVLTAAIWLVPDRRIEGKLKDA